MVFGGDGDGVLVDVHIADGVVEGIGGDAGALLDHADGERRHGGDFLGEFQREFIGAAVLRHFLDQAPFLGGFGADLIGDDAELLGARRAHQVDHARHRLPAHIHAVADFRHPEDRAL